MQLHHQDSLSAACNVPPTGGEAALVSCSSVANASSGQCEWPSVQLKKEKKKKKKGVRQIIVAPNASSTCLFTDRVWAPGP